MQMTDVLAQMGGLGSIIAARNFVVPVPLLVLIRDVGRVSRDDLFLRRALRRREALPEEDQQHDDVGLLDDLVAIDRQGVEVQKQRIFVGWCLVEIPRLLF